MGFKKGQETKGEWLRVENKKQPLAFCPLSFVLLCCCLLNQLLNGGFQIGQV